MSEILCMVVLWMYSPDVIARKSFSRDTLRSLVKPEVLNAGFIDVMPTGQVNASARLVRIYIGEPGKFSIPLSLYSGVSANNFQNQQNPMASRINDQLVSHYINPMSGLINLSVQGTNLLHRQPGRISGAGITYQLGERLLTGYKSGQPGDPATGRPVNFMNTVAAAGLYVQTGAWEKNINTTGVCWLSVRYIVSHSGNGPLNEFSDFEGVKGICKAWSAGWGIDISNVLNVKMVVYKYIDVPGEIFRNPVYQFTFNYSMK